MTNQCVLPTQALPESFLGNAMASIPVELDGYLLIWKGKIDSVFPGWQKTIFRHDPIGRSKMPHQKITEVVRWRSLAGITRKRRIAATDLSDTGLQVFGQGIPANTHAAGDCVVERTALLGRTNRMVISANRMPAITSTP